MKPAETLFMDSTEAYAWGMQFLGGYGRHPPLTGWIARVWYSAFPATHWSSYALSGVMIGISIGSIYLIGLRVLGRRRATLIVFAMMFYPLFIGAKADRFNNYQVLLAVLPLTIWLFLRAYDKPNVRSGIALGLSAAAATLTIYSAAFGLIGIALAALIHPHRRKFFTQSRALRGGDHLPLGVVAAISVGLFTTIFHRCAGRKALSTGCRIARMF